MCGRYAITSAPEAVRTLFAYEDGPDFPSRYNISPTQPIPIVRLEEGRRRFALVRWGLVPPWVKDPREFSLLVNARGESVLHKPAFRAAMHRRRCLVPADGFFEWNKDKKDKRPWRIVDPDRPAFAFAGIWEGWRNPEGEITRSFAIITTNANQKLAPVHDRMPVILNREDEDAWLDPGSAEPKLLSLLTPYDAGKTALYRVDTRVNSVKNDDPECLARIE